MGADTSPVNAPEISEAQFCAPRQTLLFLRISETPDRCINGVQRITSAFEGFDLKYVSIASANLRPSASSMFIFQFPATIFFLIDFYSLKCILNNSVRLNVCHSERNEVKRRISF